MSQNGRGKKARESNANPLFSQWLKEWRDEAASKNSHSKFIYARALQSLSKFPLPLKSGKECHILKNFGQKICDLLDKKLEEHRRLNPEFDENACAPLAQPKDKQTRRPVKTRAPTLDGEPRAGPSRVQGTVETNGTSLPRSNPSSEFQAAAISTKPRVKSKVKSLAIGSLKVQKPNGKAKIIPRKSKGNYSSRKAPIAVIEPRVRSPSPPAPLSPPEVSMSRFSFEHPELPIKNGNKPEAVVIDLSQHDDSPEPGPDVDSLLSLTNRLLAATGKEICNESAIKGVYDIDKDDSDADCVIVSENFETIFETSPKRPPDMRTPPKPGSSLEHVPNDFSINDAGEQKSQEHAAEDSFLELLPKLKKPVIEDEDDDSILDIAAGIRKKRESFLGKLSFQAPPKQPVFLDVPKSSFFNSPNTSIAELSTVAPPRRQDDNVLRITDDEEPEEERAPSPRKIVPLEISEDSDDELLIPLSERLKSGRAPQPPPSPRSPPPPQNDSFAQLVENLETPPVSRVVKPGQAEELQIPSPERPRKRTKKATGTLDVDAAPNKKPRKNKCKPQTAPAVPIRVFDLRYVPEGSRPPNRSTSNNMSQTPSKCPHRISLEPGTFDIVLCVDSCEASGGVSTKKKEAMVEALQSSGVKMEIRKMNVGDFAWIAKSGDHELVLDCVVERKRIDDLASSIKDGRYAEQKHRLLTSGIKRKIYLIEEYNRFATGGITDQALLQAQVNTQVINDFVVKITKNTKESVRYLTTLTRALEVKYRNMHLRSCLKEEVHMFENHLMTWREYNESGYKRKKVCTREMFIRALMVIRGMSLERALTIATVYPTVTALVQAFDRCDEVKSKDKLLADLRCPISGRRIGPALSKVLKQIFVHGRSDE